MCKLSEITEILQENGNKFINCICKSDSCFSSYFPKRGDVIILNVHLYYSTCHITLYIDVDPSSREVYVNRGYDVDHHCKDEEWVCGSKDFQSFEDLLDELQELGLINCGRNIKSAC